MALTAAAVFFGVMFALVILSAIAPMQSQSRFWRTIHRCRAGLDRAVYWFFNVCTVLSILYLVFMTLRGL